MSEASRRRYASDSVKALKSLALSGHTALDVKEAIPSLTRALSTRSGPGQLEVAEVLASIDDDAAQQALVTAALASQSDQWQQVALLDIAAESVRRFGDRVSIRQADDLRQFIVDARGEVADAAARLYGALNRGSALAG